MEGEKGYQTRMEKKLTKLITEIDELKKQTDELGSEKQEELRQELTKVDSQTKATQKKLEELEKGEYEAQRVLQSYLEHSLDDLRNYLDIYVLPHF